MKNQLKIRLRPINNDDYNFLYKIYCSTRIDEMMIAQWPEYEREEFLRSQFQLQHTQYLSNNKNATFNIILLDDVLVGRIYMDRKETEIRIIDIALLKEFRNKGIGTKILNDIIEESEKSKTPISLYVDNNSLAKNWYERHGFSQEGDTGVYIFMKRNPQSVS